MANKQKSKNSKKHLFVKKAPKEREIKYSRFSQQQLFLFALVFALLGGFIVFKSFAAPSDPPDVTLTANPSTILQAQSTTLNWTSNLANSCHATWTASTATSGSQVVSPGNQTTTYTITCYNVAGSTQASATVTVNPWPPAVSFTANPATIIKGQSSTLSWNASGASYCDTNWIGREPASGGNVATPASTTTYSMTCYGPGGGTGASATVTVLNSPTVSLSASPDIVKKGTSTKLSWTSTSATSCSNNWGGSTGPSGSSTVTPSATTKYTITCNGAGGNASSNTTVTVYTDSPPKPTVSLTASPASIAYNGYSNLQWNSANATSCSAGWTGLHGTNGSQQVGRLTASTSYSISCGGPGGSVSASTRVAVGAAPSGCPPKCPTPAPPPAPTQPIAVPTTDDTTSTDQTDQTNEAAAEPTVQKYHQNHIKNFLLGGLLGELISLMKHGSG